MAQLLENLYFHAPAWQVAAVLVVTAGLVLWLSARAFRVDAARALSVLSPDLGRQPVFVLDRRTGLRPLNRSARRLLRPPDAGHASGAPAAGDTLLEALTGALNSASVVHHREWPVTGQALVAVPVGAPGRPPSAVLGIVVEETLAATALAPSTPEAWLSLSPSVRVHTNRPVVLTRHGADSWVESALTPPEDALLRRLLADRGGVVPADDLFRAAWPDDPVDRLGLRPEQSDRLRRLVFQLRRHLEPDPGQPRHVRTARGSGYALYSDDAAS
jgi:hypothetical protein